MIFIQKGKEPISLKKYKKEKYAYFDGCNKNDIRASLLKEQGYLCAYCMRRIENDPSKMTIEHWFPESDLSESEKLNYSNMLGVCKGHAEGTDGRDATCDASKKNTKITIDPRKRDHIFKILYRIGTGEIYSEDEKLCFDMTHTLNLNSKVHYLPQNRRSTLQAAIRKLHSLKSKKYLKRADIEKMIRMYSLADSEGRKKEFAGIVLWYFEKERHQGKEMHGRFG